MVTSPVSSNDAAAAAAALQAQQAAAKSTSSSQGMKDQFLTLLVTQLRNQDPLNPMDNAALTTQLAQISTVEGIEKLNSTVTSSLESISGQIDFSQSVQAVSMIGKEVLVPGNKISLGTDPSNSSVRGATPFGVDLQAAASTLTVKINDANGNTLRTLTLQNQPVGVMGLEWDGLTDDGAAAPDGAYTVAVSATDAAGNAMTSLEALSYGRVNSVGYTAQGLRLDLGLAGQVGMLDVRKVFTS
ncbi:MAG: flagellar hook assembly protein FlgD [Burkholderiaceae bacterium]|nr:flagellar hook assembly protein FlgD [Burkholderiaceae bacterium]